MDKRLLAVGLTGLVALGCGGPGNGGQSPDGGGTTTIPDPVVTVTGDRKTFQGTSYVIPPGMTEQVFADGVVLQGAPLGGSGTCSISVLAPQAAEADAPQQAVDVLSAFVAPDYTGLRDENGGVNPASLYHRGVSGAGWSYVLVKGNLLDASGNLSAPARVMLVNLGANVVPVIGLDGASSGSCFEDYSGKTLAWQLLFYSLQFPSYTATGTTPLSQQLLGKWFINTGTIFLGEVFAANARYSTQSAFQTYSQISSTEVLETTTSFSGDGRYEVHADRLTRVPSSGKAKTVLFRIEEDTNSSVATGWLPNLCELDLSSDGVPYEYVLRRDTTQ